MTRWLLVGPTPLAGIGQVVKKYADLLEGKYITYNEDPPGDTDFTFVFFVPHGNIVEYIKKKFNPTLVMTVCETYPVNKKYKEIFDTFKNIVVTPSQFCSDIFKKQFSVNVPVLYHYTGNFTIPVPVRNKSVYIFYTIGNVIDPRKNIKMLIEAFIRCNFGDEARLVIKATCVHDFNIKIPNVHVINGLVDEKSLETLHETCDCYVNCSHSEGVGMGAVEAAIRNKPVIITDYGGLQEYVKTPFVVKTEPSRVGITDFLFEPDMMWSRPYIGDLISCMRDCFEQRIVEWDHAYTRNMTSAPVLRAKFTHLCTTLAGSSV